jgi:hypothetical protein
VSSCLVLEQAEGYVKTRDKSTPPLSTMRKVFEQSVQNDTAGGKRLKFVLKLLSYVRSGETDETRTIRLSLCQKFP